MDLRYDFNSGRQGFGYADDAFRLTDAPGYASGVRTSTGGVGGSGALEVRLGGRDGADIAGMSGGWSTTFTLAEAQTISLTFRYNLTQSSAYEANEFSDVLVALDGVLKGVGGTDRVARIVGDGDGGPARSTGWKTVTIEFGELAAGNHTLTFGGFNNLKTDRNESTNVRFDDIAITGTPSAPGGGSDTGGSAGTDGGTGGTGGALSLEAFEARVLELTNAFRLQNGLPALENDAKLNAAAEDWSRTMATGDFFRHSTTAQVEEYGYDWRAWGENIAAGYTTPEAVVQGWINSPGHRANMLSTRFEEIGIGHHYLASDTGSVNYRHYWTQVFGTEADSLV